MDRMNERSNDRIGMSGPPRRDAARVSRPDRAARDGVPPDPPLRSSDAVTGKPSCCSSLASEALEGLRVLVVEDDDDTREAMQCLLEMSDVEVTAVESAELALDAFRAAARAGGYDVLIADIGLVSMDGYELLRRLRAIERKTCSRPVPAIAMTGYTRRDERRRAAQAGFQSYLPKPVDLDTLLATIATLAGRAA